MAAAKLVEIAAHWRDELYGQNRQCQWQLRDSLRQRRPSIEARRFCGAIIETIKEETQKLNLKMPAVWIDQAAQSLARPAITFIQWARVKTFPACCHMS